MNENESANGERTLRRRATRLNERYHVCTYVHVYTRRYDMVSLIKSNAFQPFHCGNDDINGGRHQRRIIKHAVASIPSS